METNEGVSNLGLPDDGHWPDKILSKATKMENKTCVVRYTFSLPATEVVIQDYHCSLGPINQGRMWITPHYVCFSSKIPFLQSIEEKIPFRLIEEVVLVEYPLSGEISLRLKDGRSLKFYSFATIQETYAVLKHLWEIPPSYMTLSPIEEEEEEEEEDEIGVKRRRGWGQGRGGEKKSYFVNVEQSKEAVELAMGSREQTGEILVELDRQGERLDRIEGLVGTIHLNLDRGERHIRGIASLGGACLNLVTRNKAARQNPKIMMREQIAQEKWAKNLQNLRLEILLKLPDDTLKDCLLVFGPTHFFVQEKSTNEPLPQYTWEYNQIKHLVIRARPLHLDVRFRDKIPRFRLMASRIQAITNELVLRSAAGVKREGEGGGVLFEPNARRFDYGSYYLTLEVVRRRDGREVVVQRKQVGTAALLSDDVADGTKQKVTEAEENLEQVYILTKESHRNAKIMGKTLDKQTKQIARIQHKTESAHSRLENQNKSVQGINRSLGGK